MAADYTRRPAAREDEITMTTQLHLARGIVAGRIHQTQDPALLRNVELARQDAKRARRR